MAGSETAPAKSTTIWSNLLVNIAMIAIAIAAAWVNRHAARKLQRQIDSLDHLAIQN
jgi:uncharacterized membrane protein